MTDKDPKDILIKPEVNPLLATIPPHLKEPEVYEKIRRDLLDELSSKHSHGDITEWAGCAGCQRKFYELGEAIKKLGFDSPAQFYAWKKVHETAKTVNRVAYEKYNS